MVIKVDIKFCGRLVDTQGTVSHSIAQKTVMSHATCVRAKKIIVKGSDDQKQAFRYAEGSHKESMWSSTV